MTVCHSLCQFSPFLQVVIIYDDDFLIIMNSFESALSLNAVRHVHRRTRGPGC